MKDEQGRKVLGKYEVVEHAIRKPSGTHKYFTVRKDGRDIPGRFHSITSASEAITAHKEKLSHKTRVVKEVY